MNKLIVSLTTIPSRIDSIGPTLRDLLNQSVKVDEIRLNLARKYRRFPGAEISVPDLPEGITIHWSDTDFGPATKVLPTVLDHRGEDVEILFCDDDQPYDKEWARKFLEHRQSHPNCCIVGKGYDLSERTLGHRYDRKQERFPRAEVRCKGLGYRMFRAVTLGLCKPHPFISDGYVDILEGHRGVMVRPSFFPNEVFDIPDILWTVDDPWLSGHLERNGVPIWLMSEARQFARPYGAHFRDRLGAYVYKKHDRLKADSSSIDHFRDTYGIWPGHKEVPTEAPRKTLRHRLGAPVPFMGTG
ncbi:MAG: glycosyltransferase family 2 protein [Rhodobacteraceae bacterium]|nr:glycosyltransferase family 2 protein [Paracoccaceae bacterium]